MRCTYGTVRIKLAKTIHVDIYGADIRFRPTLTIWYCHRYYYYYLEMTQYVCLGSRRCIKSTLAATYKLWASQPRMSPPPQTPLPDPLHIQKGCHRASSLMYPFSSDHTTWRQKLWYLQPPARMPICFTLTLIRARALERRTLCWLTQHSCARSCALQVVVLPAMTWVSVKGGRQEKQRYLGQLLKHWEIASNHE
jgi:hypothetical protein